MAEPSSTTDEQQSWPTFDVATPHLARIWNYWLGGKDNYPVDRALGDKIRGVFPDMDSFGGVARKR